MPHRHKAIFHPNRKLLNNLPQETMKRIPIIVASIIAIASVGCASYSHSRTLKDGTVEKTSVSSTFNRTALSRLKFTSTDSGGYSRNISLGGWGSDISAELAPLIEAISKGVAEGMAAQKADK